MALDVGRRQRAATSERGDERLAAAVELRIFTKRPIRCDNVLVSRPILFPRVSNITLQRRRNALTLFQSFAEAALAAGAAPKGLEQSFAASLEISPSMWSQIKSSRPIGDKLARQIEQHCGKPAGWLDEEREAAGLSQAEQQFVALALKAWRSTNSAGRKALRARLHEIAKGG